LPGALATFEVADLGAKTLDLAFKVVGDLALVA
jgi:hypothetical protein